MIDPNHGEHHKFLMKRELAARLRRTTFGPGLNPYDWAWPGGFFASSRILRQLPHPEPSSRYLPHHPDLEDNINSLCEIGGLA
jgi:hypothetical protein